MTFNHYNTSLVENKVTFLSNYNTAFPFPHKQNLTPRKQQETTQTRNSFHKCHLYICSKTPNQPMAYFWVQLRAVASYLARSVLYIWAISGTSGSSGFGSVSSEQIESSTWYAEQNIVIKCIEIHLNISTEEWVLHTLKKFRKLQVNNCVKKHEDGLSWNKILNSYTT